MTGTVDYTAEVVFTEETAREDIETAREFIREISGILNDGGWFESESTKSE